MKNKDPIKDPNFVRYLILFGVGLVTLWAIFDWFILPMLPEGLAFGLMAMGLGVGAITWALLIINRYESKYTDNE